MKVSRERVAGLAQLLVEKLSGGGMLDPVADPKALVASLERVITDELSVEDRINAEAKELMRQYEPQIAAGHMNEQELFKMIKKQLVKQKGAIL